MKSHYLLPNKYKIPGWILLSIGIVFGLFIKITGYESENLVVNVFSIFSDGLMFDHSGGFFNIIKNSIVDELAALAIIVGGLMVGFSKEKVEDEFIYKLRKDSLIWALLFNYAVLIFTIIFVYDFAFFDVLVFNMFTPLLFFICRFNFLKLKA